MARTHRIGIGAALSALVVTLAVAPGRAHKPITSPFTYTEDVFPILRDRCGRCHVPGGVAPMSLMTYEDTVPWGESIRVELLARHMPPWNVDAAPARFRNAQPLSAREMNVLLTWATGGTPLGNPEKMPPPVTSDRRWPLGPPDLEIPLPREFTLAADAQEDTVEFVVPTSLTERRWLRAIDLAPGTPAIVRSATVQLRPVQSADPASSSSAEPMLALWLPGDVPVKADDGSAFELPASAELLVGVRYKKTWLYEQREMRDRSTIGLYFAREAEPIRALELRHDGPALRVGGSSRQIGQPLPEGVRALAIYPVEHPAHAGITVAALAPDGSRRELIAFHPHRDWARRYWFQEPIPLARGTRIETTVAFDDETPVLPLSPAAQPSTSGSSAVRLVLNVISPR